jgi:hypothetical protein
VSLIGSFLRVTGHLAQTSPAGRLTSTAMQAVVTVDGALTSSQSDPVRCSGNAYHSSAASEERRPQEKVREREESEQRTEHDAAEAIVVEWVGAPVAAWVCVGVCVCVCACCYST